MLPGAPDQRGERACVLFCRRQEVGGSLDFGRVFATIAGFLEAEGFPFAVVGAFGLHAFGVTRATQDLDMATDSAAQPKLVPTTAEDVAALRSLRAGRVTTEEYLRLLADLGAATPESLRRRPGPRGEPLTFLRPPR